MRSEIPTEGLSDHFAERMNGRRLLAAVFTTFNLDPGFFEQDVLPAFVDVTLSHAAALRLVQLEDVLRQLPHGIAVYYDANGLVSGDAGSAKLDVARIPLRVSTGVFHAKNVLLLTEAIEPDDQGHHEQTLIVACLSANLTRGGWWRNVEVAHVEEIQELGTSRMRAELLELLGQLRALAPKGTDHTAQEAIRRFLVHRTSAHPHRTYQGRLRPHLWCSSQQSLVEFLKETAGDALDGLYMEVISPFFGPGGQSLPLSALLEALEPKECRVFLPKADDGSAQVEDRLYAWLREQPRCGWGTLPSDVTRLGKSKDAGHRFVHAKVIRFFSQRPKREFLLVGSPNLTGAAHARGQNLETAFLLEVPVPRAPDFWLEPETRKTTQFAEAEPSSDRASAGGTRLSLRFDWNSAQAHAHWEGDESSPTLSLSALGTPLFELEAVPAQTWVPLSAAQCERLQQVLASTALLDVEGDGPDPGLLLVQEEGMAQKPSLLLQLSAADILRYWSLLTDAQRTAFIEARATDIMLMAGGGDLLARSAPLQTEAGMFDRFAGFFHAFATLSRAVHGALESGRERDAAYRMFGRKYDSLGTLLERVAKAPDHDAQALSDPIDRYLVALCAQQLVTEVQTQRRDFWDRHEEQAAGLRETLDQALAVRAEILDSHPEREQFLRWYEAEFLTHARDLGDPS